MVKKFPYKIVSSLLLLFGGLLLLRFIASPEDTWICVNDDWVRHGHPANPAPQAGCGVTAAMVQAIGQKYQRLSSTIVVETQSDDGKFAKGSIRFANEGGGALWLAVKVDRKWTLVYDGQGPMGCPLAEQYNFPKELAPGCIDSKTGDFVQR